MKKNILLLILSLIKLASSFQLPNCAGVNVGYSLFDLCGLTQSNPFNVTSVGSTLSFSVGNNNVDGCSDDSDVWGTYQTLGNCYEIAVQAPTYSLIDESDSTQGIVVTFPTASDNSSNTTYQLIVNLECNSNITDANQIQFTWSQKSGGNNTDIITVTGSSSSACPVISLSTVVNYFNQNKGIFAGGFAFLGLILLIFGFRLKKLAMFLIPTILTGLALAYFLFAVVTVTQLWAIYAIMGGSLLAGIIVGIIALWKKRFAYFVIGAALGVVVGFLIYNAILSPLIKGLYGVVPLYLTLGISGLIGGALGIWLFESILILSTCLIGSFLMVRCVAEFIGGFPAESEVAQGLEQFDLVTYAYLTVIVILAAIGIYIQVKQKRKASAAKKQEVEEPKENPEDVYNGL